MATSDAAPVLDQKTPEGAMARALVVDDDPDFQGALVEVVQQEGFSVETAGTLKAARTCLEERPPDLVLVDLNLPDGSGLELLRDLEGRASTEVVLITGHATVDSAVEALRHGATDYLAKPVDRARLKAVLVNVARRRQLRDEIDNLRGELRSLGRFGLLIGASPAMQGVYDLMGRVAPTDATVLLEGESGTGKELAARTLHELSRRRKQPFLPLNCGAVSPQLIESELFGHERGSFTGADRTHKGFFERAAGGTLLLDEITEMPIELQVKLLRVLETGSVSRIGGEREIPVDVRVIAATNREPRRAVEEGRLRQDLLYRLSVFPIVLPPLRERVADVELLAEHFLSQLNAAEGTGKRFTKRALAQLRAHAWPGNVRELKNAVHQAFILADDEIGADCVLATRPLTAGAAQPVVEDGRSVLHLSVGCTVREAERRLILATLDGCGGNKDKTAKVLGISLKTLYNRLNAYGLPDTIRASRADSRRRAAAEEPDHQQAESQDGEHPAHPGRGTGGSAHGSRDHDHADQQRDEQE